MASSVVNKLPPKRTQVICSRVLSLLPHCTLLAHSAPLENRGRLDRGAVYDRQSASGTFLLWILCSFEEIARRTSGPPRGRRAGWPRSPPPTLSPIWTVSTLHLPF